MRILVISDSHRANANVKKVLERVGKIDAMIHLGDAEGSEDIFRQWLEPDCELFIVRGNNDFFSDLESERSVQIGRYSVLLCHGHLYNVSLGVELLRKEARARNYDVAMYGHTHRPYFENRDGLVILNPGSISYPRQEGRKPSYLIMEIDGKGNAHYTQNYLER